jgi:hypothetical protein
MNLLRNGTSQVVRFGPFLDSTDGVTPETGLTIAQTDMQLSKDGAAFAQKNAAGNATHDTDGWYSTTFDATDTATNGILLLQVNVSGALPVWHEYYVVPSSTYDALTTNGLNNVAATDVVSAGAITTSSGAVSTVTSVTNQVTADVTAISGDSTAANNLELDYDGTGYNKTNSTIGTCTTNTDMRGTDSALLASAAPTNFSDLSITASTGLVDITQTAADKVWSSTTRTVSAATNITSDASAITMSSSGVVGTVNLVNTTTTNTDMRGTDTALLASSAPTNFSALGISVGGAIDNVTLVATTTTNTDMRGTDSALLAASAPTNFSDLSITASAGLVDITQSAADKAWSTSTRLLTAGTNIVLAKGVGVTGFNDLSAAQVNAEVVDVIFTDTYAEPGSVPAATSSISAKLKWVFTASRNKLLQTNTTQTIRNDADSAAIATSTVSDDGTTFTRGEFT